MAKIGVVIATFGSDDWKERGLETFLSLEEQTVKEDGSVHIHGETLAEARNTGAGWLGATEAVDYLIFLDADDRLDKDYIKYMKEACSAVNRYSLFQPSSLGVENGIEDNEPVLIPEKNLMEGNFLIIGTMIPKELFEKVGGFDEWPAFEDWHLFLKCSKVGFELIKVPEAIYKVTVTPNGRNEQSKNYPSLYMDIKRDVTQRFN